MSESEPEASQYVEEMIGARVGDYTLKELAGEGTFSHVFRATDRLGQNERAIKVPRPFSRLHKEERSADENIRDVLETEVHMRRQERFTQHDASPLHLLRIQVARLRNVHDQGLVRIEDYSFGSGGSGGSEESSGVSGSSGSHCRMPFLEGRTFRDYLASGPVPVAVLRNLALTLARLKHIDGFGYHGDVKPENMIVTANGVILVDCGFFGGLSLTSSSSDPEKFKEQREKTLIVTTPRYYPRFLPDDLLAFGLILWEAALRKRLIDGISSSEDFDGESVSSRLMDMVLAEEALGNFNFSAILGAERPALLREGMPEMMETLLLKAVRLKFIKNGSILDIDEGFDSFEDIADALKKLTRSGIYYL